MPEPTCPFCEAPFSGERTRPAITKGEKEVIPPTVLKHWSCGTFSMPRVHDSEECFTRAELCVARQRLFDDIYRDCFMDYARGMENRKATDADLRVADERGCTVDEVIKTQCSNAAMRDARVAVNRRYPLPAKDAADADQAK